LVCILDVDLVAFVGYGRLVINGGILICCVDQSNVEIFGDSVVGRLDVWITFWETFVSRGLYTYEMVLGCEFMIM